MERPPSRLPGEPVNEGRMPTVIARVVLPLAVLISFAVLIFMRVASAWGLGSGSVLSYHGAANRSGQYVMQGLTWESAARLHRDEAFDGTIEGHVYAQPLYWHPPGAKVGLLIVVTESNVVYALNATTGVVVWKKALAQPARRADLPCGNIDPLGMTGTPVIDPTKGALYVDAMVRDGQQLKHVVYGLSLRDGAVLQGWPVDIAAGLKAHGMAFDARVQNQRAALMLAGGRLYVPYGGHTGDCGGYRGWVVGVELDKPSVAGAWHTRGVNGGIWAPAGLAAVDNQLFVTTGNTRGATSWADGEAVVRLRRDKLAPARSDDPQDFFAPANWRQLDANDLDLGGMSALPLDVRSRRLMIALGKDGKAYLLDRDNLGGIGGALDVSEVSRAPITGAMAAWTAGETAFVAFSDMRPLSSCGGNGGNGGLTVLRIDGAGKRAVKPAWCRPVDGMGSPITTTSDGHGDRIVWVVGAEGDNRLHGFKADTGDPVFAGDRQEDSMPGLRHFVTIVAANDRLYVAGDGKVYAFTLGK